MLCQQGVRLTTGGIKVVLRTAEGDELQELETSHRVRMRRRLEDTRVDDDLPTKSCFPPPHCLYFIRMAKVSFFSFFVGWWSLAPALGQWAWENTKLKLGTFSFFLLKLGTSVLLKAVDLLCRSLLLVSFSS